MTIEETFIKGCYVITPKIINDERGLFFESYNNDVLKKHIGVNTRFVQDNQSISKKGVLRGLHLQEGEFSQAKLVRVVKGTVLDVCVDLREGSETFGKHFSTVLSEKNNKQIYIPRGFAHGFLTLSTNAIFCYKCDNYYNKDSEKGVLYDDPELNINWGFSKKEIVISKKDKTLPSFRGYLNER